MPFTGMYVKNSRIYTSCTISFSELQHNSMGITAIPNSFL